MKKFYSVIVCMVALLCTTPTMAQIKYGVKGGLNVTNMSFSENVFDASNRTGWFFGPTMKISLPLPGLGVDASALYDYRSAKVDAKDNTLLSEKVTVKQQQITLPVNLRYGWGLGSMANLYLYAGPQWGINVGNKNFKWEDGSSYSLKNSDFSVNFGFGTTLFKHLQVSANYNVACGKSADADLKTIENNVMQDKSHNNSWQIALAYYF
ncbi:MAG: porin family protein [Prevotella sp.]|nr:MULTISPECIES: porin family protein [unclassified Prevotella]MCH3970036.1 porin family protein [Prevotella sp.]MCH3985965.1 porin family protein [Prevotella sp.]MCH3991344.1 porin family protein [Prevotella sp.]MCH4018519.1 porin family protein [Prevotella sp.]MCH4100372.1 porin family protein [Prevotella sp.]